MLFSISNSNDQIPGLPWMKVFGSAICAFALAVCGLEIALRARGFEPTALDSEPLWIKQRIRASALGSHALILVGASRIQLGVDLNRLGKTTRLIPVQLAIDGTSALSALSGLAADPTIRGTILVDYYASDFIGNAPSNTAIRYERDFIKQKEAAFSGSQLEGVLVDALTEHLASYADSATPISSFLLRVIAPDPAHQYLITTPDRSRSADYRLVKMPKFYYSRVATEMGEEKGVSGVMSESREKDLLDQRIRHVTPLNNAEFLQALALVKSQVQTLKKRGATVIFIRMPVSGMIQEFEDRRYPRNAFWDEFVKSIGAPSINFEDVPSMSGAFLCPDGSHLDFRDKARFTDLLAGQLSLIAVPNDPMH